MALRPGQTITSGSPSRNVLENRSCRPEYSPGRDHPLARQHQPRRAFGLTVTVKDGSGNVVQSFSGDMTISLSNNPGGSTLGGTLIVPINSGVATFSGLTLNELGVGYTFQVSATGPSPVTTSPINVVPVVYPAVADLGFQTPYVGVGPMAFKIDPTGSAWTFTGSAGLAGNSSALRPATVRASRHAGWHHPADRRDQPDDQPTGRGLLAELRRGATRIQ